MLRPYVNNYFRDTPAPPYLLGQRKSEGRMKVVGLLTRVGYSRPSRWRPIAYQPNRVKVKAPIDCGGVCIRPQ
jgi:hypothetical protein